MHPLRTAAVASSALLILTSCGDPSSSAGSDSGPIVIASSLSLSGPLGSLGVLQQKGYEQAVEWINDDGGLQVGSKKRKIKLVIKDNQSDPNLASQQTREAVLQDDAVALLGPCTPPVTIPVAKAAESQRVPLLSTCNPVGAFAAGNESGWKYSWNAFFSEQDQARTAFEAFDQVTGNKKVALFTDTEPDGVIERKLYKKVAAERGYQVVGDYTFPVGTTDFSSFINKARRSGAQFVVAQTVPPDGIALWKQMKALGLKPRAAFSAKAAVSGAWWDALKQTAEGTLTEGFWSPAVGNPQTKQIEASLGKQISNVPDMGVAVASLSTAQVLTDAISTAGSTDAAKVNAAIAKTDKKYPVGTVKFNGEHVSVTPHLILQWKNGDASQVVPRTDSSVEPASGLG